MSLTYIAGFDGSPASTAAVRVARQLGETTGADVIVATVYVPTPLVAGKGSSAMADAELDEAIRNAAERTIAELQEPEGVLRRVVPGSSAAHGLHRLAEQEEASLIAVGVTHHGPVGRILLGSVGHRLLHGSPCPVVVVPADAPQAIGKIAVAFDGEAESRLALALATDLAARLGSQLLIVAAAQPTSYGVAGAPTLALEAERIAKERAQAFCDEAIVGLPDGVRAEAQVVLGPTGRMIAEAVDGNADLLVAGSRAYGPVKSVLLGSTSGYLADHAACPVLVVPRGAGTTIDGARTRAVATEA
jgi:nucleotide-binding universal stress UspA family protein